MKINFQIIMIEMKIYNSDKRDNYLNREFLITINKKIQIQPNM
jgi:hypothetical protein